MVKWSRDSRTQRRGFLHRQAKTPDEREAWEKVWPFKNDTDRRHGALILKLRQLRIGIVQRKGIVVTWRDERGNQASPCC
jgi:hypothetical protein